MNDDYLFVYGTLRQDTNSEMYRLLARFAVFVDEATYQGRLFKIDYYPGVVPSRDPSHKVHGEVYCLPIPERVLPLLDKYEECGSGFPEPTEYVRRQQEVLLRSGNKLMAWVYLYNWPVNHLELIPSGDFLGFGVGSQPSDATGMPSDRK